MGTVRFIVCRIIGIIGLVGLHLKRFHPPWEPLLDINSSESVFFRGIPKQDRYEFLRSKNYIRHEGMFSRNIPLITGEQIEDLEDSPELFDTVVCEGSPVYKTHLVYERNVKNREEALKIHGYKCGACGIDYKKLYGNAADNIIEVHHIRPVSKGIAVYNPNTDLIPLCGNCHKAVHSGKFGDPEESLQVLISFLKNP
jgi:predicted restriction endonuclease